MGKKDKVSVIESVMDELNEEIVSSSSDFFISDLVNENLASEQKAQNQNLESLIYFDPHKVEEDNKQKAPQKKAVKFAGKLKKKNKKELLKEKTALKSHEKEREKPQENQFVANKKAIDSRKLKFEENPVNFEKKERKPLKNTQVLQTMQSVEKAQVSQNMQSENAKAIYENVVTQNKIPMRITLQQSENLRVAQDRIVALETEIERLRMENEDLIATGDIFRERLDKIIVQNDNLKRTYEESREEFQQEKRALLDTLNSQTLEIEKMTVKNKELEKRLFSNIQQIRVRERELENRLELMKLDSQTLAREKDQYILDLKRQIDRMKMDSDTQKSKHNEISNKLEGYRSQNRNVIRGLQMILNVAKGGNMPQEAQTQQFTQAKPEEATAEEEKE